MRLSSFNLSAMLLMLSMGLALGAWIFRYQPNTVAATESPLAPSVPESTPDLVDEGIGRESLVGVTKESDDAEYLGVVFPRQSADVVSRTEGILQTVEVNLGDRVKAGNVIARTETSTQRLQIAEAALRLVHAEHTDAELELKDAEARYRRRAELAKEGLISTEEFSTAQVHLDKAKAKLLAAQARVAEETARTIDAKESLANTVIRAPFDGIVAARFLDAGAAVRFGTPVISLMRPDDLWVRFAIPQAQRTRVGVGTIIQFQSEHSSMSVPGAVAYLSPSVTSVSQDLLVEARLNLATAFQGRVKAGETGIVSLQTR